MSDVRAKCPHYDAPSLRDKVCVDCWRSRALELAEMHTQQAAALTEVRLGLGAALRVSIDDDDDDDVPVTALAARAHAQLEHDRMQTAYLHKKNNEYLERARTAERELTKSQITSDALATQNVRLQQDLVTAERENADVVE